MSGMKRIDWDALAPLGLGGRLTAKKIRGGLIASAIFACFSYWAWLDQYLRQLYQGSGIVRKLRPGAVMTPFYQTLDSTSLLGYAMVALFMLPLAAWHYLYHYQDSRSIYLMRRLPDRWELWRRCLALPLLGLAACGVLSAIHVPVAYAIYRFATPAQCLQGGQWSMLWENLFH